MSIKSMQEEEYKREHVIKSIKNLATGWDKTMKYNADKKKNLKVRRII